MQFIGNAWFSCEKTENIILAKLDEQKYSTQYSIATVFVKTLEQILHGSMYKLLPLNANELNYLQ